MYAAAQVGMIKMAVTFQQYPKEFTCSRYLKNYSPNTTLDSCNNIIKPDPCEYTPVRPHVTIILKTSFFVSEPNFFIATRRPTPRTFFLYQNARYSRKPLYPNGLSSAKGGNSSPLLARRCYTTVI